MKKILVGLYQFDGPFNAETELLHQPGLIAILANDVDRIELVAVKAAEDLSAL